LKVVDDPEHRQKQAVRAARSAGLCYVRGDDAGIARLRKGAGFCYRRADGRLVRDAATLKRIGSLVIPPAWTEVWICTNPLGHLQATGRDARGRKQYRYHARWRSTRDETKYGRLLDFARALPRIRGRVRRDLRRPGLSRNKVLATVVRLLEVTLMRVGNEEYARQNGSFGLSTLRDRHAKIQKGELCFEFRGKSGVTQSITVQDPRLARIVKRCRDIPGQVLFQYLDENGRRRPIGSADVNAYLREAAGADFTAKDFRTWAGTVLALETLQAMEGVVSKAQAKKNIVCAVRAVAERLGNTVAVCRKCYIHPVVFDAYLEGTLASTNTKTLSAARQLRAEESAIIRLLRAQS
jgi:DNA topoisomerase I